jgi:hypothetical protein
VSTKDGWPSESYIELERNKRLLLGFSSIDPQMSSYNSAADNNFIFPLGYIRADQNDTGKTCFRKNGTINMSEFNASWTSLSTIIDFSYPTSPSSDLAPLLNLTSNTTFCGISPLLNVTLLGATAGDNYIPYQNFSMATVWSWAPGEPKSNTVATGEVSMFDRCATTNPDLNGRWVVTNCSTEHYASCQSPSQRYNWTLSSNPISYSIASQACPSGYIFAAPRTALENSYLTVAMRNSGLSLNENGAWVDFNSLDYPGCWVTGGPNATCPYINSTQDVMKLRTRNILVSFSA